MSQVDLFGMTKADQEFETFHKKNPDVYAEFVKLAQEAKKRGRSRIGIKMLAEVIRWNRFLNTTDDDYKINNNFVSRYARLIVQAHPELEEMFEFRKLRS